MSIASLVVCGVISAAIVWGLPWLHAKAVAAMEQDIKERVDALLEEQEEVARSEQLDLLYDQLYEVKTCIKLGRHDVAKERIEQIMFELETE